MTRQRLNAMHVLAQQHGGGIGQALMDRLVEEFRTQVPILRYRLDLTVS